jgi:DNA-directed RNA polymerase III subunit RPC6
MLFELTPSREVTGGAWYTEQDYDAEFVDVVKHQCLQYIQKQASLSQKIYCSPKPKSNLFKCICYQRLWFFTFQEEA